MHLITTNRRNLYIQSTTLASPVCLIMSFTHLKSLSIDFSVDGMATQRHTIETIFKPLIENPASSLRLQSLNLTSLARIDLPLLKNIAKCFPLLDTLRLSCTERLFLGCCWPCLEDSASSIIHSPIPDMFSSPDSLAVRPF